MSIEQQPNHLSQETPVEILSNLDQLEAEALQAQQAATQTLQEIATHKARQNIWTKPNSKKSQKDFDTVQSHLDSTQNRDLYADTISEQSTPEPTQLLKLKQEAIARGDKTTVMDIRNHKTGTDQLADVLSQEKLSRRELAELRRTAIDYGDQDSVLTIQNALSAKLGLTKSAPEAQQAAFAKLDRLYKLTEKTSQPSKTGPAFETIKSEAGPAQTPTLEGKDSEKALDDAVAHKGNLSIVVSDSESDTKVAEPTVEPSTVSSVEEGATGQYSSSVVPEAIVKEEPPVSRPNLVLVPDEARPDKTESKSEATSKVFEQLKSHSLGIGSAERSLKGEDRIIKNAERNLYAVIDGVGGHEAGDVAADVIQNALTEYWSGDNAVGITTENAPELMKEAFTLAHESLLYAATIDNHGSLEMGAAATAIKFFEDAEGNLRAVVGHAGDTRLYLQSGQSEQIDMLTKDEGEGNIIYNGIFANSPTKLDQFFVTPVLELGSRLMLCSDGITGDTKEQFLTEEELANAFAELSEQDVADRLLGVSRKQDDKSVLVIDVEPDYKQQTLEAIEDEKIAPLVSLESAPEITSAEDPEDLQTVADVLNGETNLKGGFFRQSLTRVRNELRPGGRVVVSEELDEEGDRMTNGQSLLMSRDRSFYEKRNTADSEDNNPDKDESDKSDRGDRPGRTRRLGRFVSDVAMMSDERIRSILANTVASRQDPRYVNTLAGKTEKQARKAGLTARRIGRSVVARASAQRASEDSRV